MPAHDASRSAVPKRAMSTPISAMTPSAVRRSTPTMVSSRASSAPKGAITTSISAEMAPMISSRKSSLARIVPTTRAWWALKRPNRASRRAGIFLRSVPRASSERISGSLVPLTSALSMSRPETPSTSEATDDSLMPASWSILSRRWASRVRSSIWALRYRVRLRSSRIGRGGTKLGRTSPCSVIWQIHSASFTSVLRPGTLRRCRALSSQHSRASSSR